MDTLSYLELCVDFLDGHQPFMICCSSIFSVTTSLTVESSILRDTRCIVKLPLLTAATSSSSRKITWLVCSMTALKQRRRIIPHEKMGLRAYGPCQAKKCLRTCPKCADTAHCMDAQSIVRAFVLHSYILQ